MKPEHHPAKIWASFSLRMAFFATALLWPAGTWQWWEAWVVIVLWFTYGLVMTVYLLRNDPALLEERLKFVPVHQDQKAWDKVIMMVFFVAAIGLYLVPGFDVVRYSWSEPLPLWMRVSGMVAHIPCFILLGWVMRENTYLSQVVKIDEKRDHHVITTGPYAIVRHPMYTIVIVLLFAVPVALGSRYGLILAVILTLLLIIRTCLEDKMLYRELNGYAAYSEKTPYRLIPGFW